MSGLIELRFEALLHDNMIFEGLTQSSTADCSSVLRRLQVDMSIFRDLLCCANHSLKTLIIYADFSGHSEYHDGDESMGDFSKLETLQQLEIQGDNFASWLDHQQKYPRRWAERVNHLPPNLRTLHLRCYTHYVK